MHPNTGRLSPPALINFFESNLNYKGFHEVSGIAARAGTARGTSGITTFVEKNLEATTECLKKESVKLIQRVKTAHLFLVFVISVPLYYFKLAYVMLHMAVKKVFETDFSKNGEMGRFNRSLLIESF